jgi:IS605 OrfB family transposase
MRRTSRVYLPWLNPGKAETLRLFLIKCRDITQYFIDLFWQRQDFTATLADLPTVHRGRDKFGITTRLAQALAKQAKEIIRSGVRDGFKRKPNFRNPTITFCYHFVTIEAFKGAFDLAIKFGGSGAPKVLIPLKSTSHLNAKLCDGWKVGKSIRLGLRNGRVFIDLILEKPRPPIRETGEILGLDSNYKAGLTCSDEQQIGSDVYHHIQKFAKRQKHTHAEAKSRMLHAMKSLNLEGVKTLVIENLKNVRRHTFGKFPRTLNRRLSHWLYRTYVAWLECRCEELGIRLKRKSPWKTSQCCSKCHRWDRRSRQGDTFLCVFCHHSEHADFNAPKNLVYLETLGAYGLYELQSLKLCSQ